MNSENFSDFLICFLTDFKKAQTQNLIFVS